MEVVRGDLRRTEGLSAAVDGADYVFHVAGLIAARGPAQFRAVNVMGTARLAQAVAATAPRCKRFVYVSSQAAAGPSPDGRPITEERPPRPLTHYGRSKLGGELVLPGSIGDVPYSIVRPPAIYGPRDEGILPFFQLAARGFAPGLEGRGRRFNLLHATDVAAGALAAARTEKGAGRTYFLSDPGGRGYAYDELASAFARVFGRPARRIPIPDLLLDAAATVTDEVAHLVGSVSLFGRQKAIELKARWWLCSSDRAVAELGWEPRIGLDDGLADTARWYEEAGRLPRRPTTSL